MEARLESVSNRFMLFSIGAKVYFASPKCLKIVRNGFENRQICQSYHSSEEKKDPKVSCKWSCESCKTPNAETDAKYHFSVVSIAQVAEQGRKDHVENHKDSLKKASLFKNMFQDYSIGYYG